MSRSLPEDWNSRRKKVYRRDDYVCQNCGRRGGSKGDTELHAHHIVPKSKGGTHRLSNLKTVCTDCHDAIHGNKLAPSAKSKVPKYGSARGHSWVAMLTFWWTLGLGNLLYAYYKKHKYNKQDRDNHGSSSVESLKSSKDIPIHGEKSSLSSDLSLTDTSENYVKDIPETKEYQAVFDSFRKEVIILVIAIIIPTILMPPFAVISVPFGLISLYLLYKWRQKYPLPKDRD